MVDAVIGVDPGGSGAAALITRDMDLKIIRFDKTKPQDIFQQIWAWRIAYDCNALIEFQGPRKNDHGHMVSFANLMKNYGVAQGILHSAGIEFDFVEPTKWQLEFGLGGKQYKPIPGQPPWNKAREYAARKRNQAIKARQLFPDHDIPEPPADAVLIAVYNWRRTFSKFLHEKRNF